MLDTSWTAGIDQIIIEGINFDTIEALLAAWKTAFELFNLVSAFGAAFLVL